MIVQADATSQDTFETDIAIIGGGASGLALAKHLKGDVIVVEAGGPVPNPERDALVTFENTGLEMNTQSLRRNLVGGAGALWSARCAEFDAQDFDPRRAPGFAGWPISFDTVAPYLQRAWGTVNLDPPTVRWREQIAGLERTLGLPEALEPQVWQYAFAKEETPLNLGAHFVPIFEDARKTLLYEADVISLQAEGNALRSVRILDRAKRTITLKARRFVLACGCVENSRILLDNMDQCDELLAPVKDNIGRGFHQHLLIENEVEAANRKAASLLQRQLNRMRAPPNASVEFGLRLKTHETETDWPLNASAILRYARSEGINPLETALLGFSWLRKREPHFINPDMSFEYSIEQVPTDTNRITLSSGRDMLGRRRPSVHWDISEEELRTTKRLNDTVGRWLEDQRLGTVSPIEHPKDVLNLSMRDSLHHMGGLRMSETPKTGVVDTDSKVHGSANLYAVGGATFPSGGHVNPTLMMFAMAIRLADHFNAQS
ncbi:MAG: GMC oxidoreductase [Pseudomonadota bacterium]